MGPSWNGWSRCNARFVMWRTSTRDPLQGVFPLRDSTLRKSQHKSYYVELHIIRWHGVLALS